MNTYQIGSVGFDPDACELHADGRTQHLQPQVRSVLLCLVRHPGEVVSKDVLVKEAWGGRRTSDESVTHCISLLRRHFGDLHQEHAIETIPKSGYRLKSRVASGETTASHAGAPHLAPTAAVPAKTVVNLVVTAAVAFALLLALVIASDFFSLR